MKTLLLILLLTFAGNVAALDECYTGSWYDPKRPGEGINIEVNSDVTVAYFYSFNEAGQQIWYSMLGDEYLAIEATAKLDDVDWVTKQVDIGVGVIEPITSTEINFRYNLLLEYVPEINDVVICEGDKCKGDFLYRRITQPIPCGK